MQESEEGNPSEGFERCRPRLFGIAYRMLGSKADSEDMVQEAYLRWHQAHRGELQSAEAWPVTVVTRLSTDRLRSSAVARETYPGSWLQEPLIGNPSSSLHQQLELASDLSTAFMVLLGQLGPQERAVFLLHDVFDCDYSEIARILGKAEARCRQIVHRARERVRNDRPRFQASVAHRSWPPSISHTTWD
jgi:RNA polymerase sigma-70 factor (ECF subfamily)